MYRCIFAHLFSFHDEAGTESDQHQHKVLEARGATAAAAARGDISVRRGRRFRRPATAVQFRTIIPKLILSIIQNKVSSSRKSESEREESL